MVDDFFAIKKKEALLCRSQADDSDLTVGELSRYNHTEHVYEL